MDGQGRHPTAVVGMPAEKPPAQDCHRIEGGVMRLLTKTVMFSHFQPGWRGVAVTHGPCWFKHRVGLLLVLALCGTQLDAAESCLQSPVMGQVVAAFMATEEYGPAGQRLWVDFSVIKGKTLAEVRAMNIGCFYILKPEKRRESMILLFEIHQRVTGKPYLVTIIENWMTRRPIKCIDKGNQSSWPYCEDQWQYGDLNADGIVNMEDIAIYGSVK